MEEHNADCYLVNTGWISGAYGAGHRIALAQTRTLVEAALGGVLRDTPLVIDPVFGLHIPLAVPGVPADLLQPRALWASPEGYDTAAAALASRFRANFERFPGVADEVKGAGPKG